LGALAAPSAQAKYVAIFRQVGPECRRDRQSSLDVTDLPVPGLRDISDQAVVAPVLGFFVSGASSVVIDKFSGNMTGPSPRSWVSLSGFWVEWLKASH